MGIPVPSYEEQQKTFCSAVLRDDRNSFYTIARIINGRWCEVSVRADKVLSSLPVNNAACFMTHNGFKGRRRETSSTRQLNALFFDIDCHDAGPEEQRVLVEQTLQRINRLIENGVLPEPTLVIDSGRGVHLLFVLECSVPYYTKVGNVLELNKKSISLFQDAQSNITGVLDEALADLNNVGVDHAVHDHARVSRIPGTYNEAAGRYAELVRYSGVYHSLSNLITYRPKRKRVKRVARGIAQVINYDRLAISRVNKIEELQKHRDFKCEGHREIMCFLYYNSLIQIYGKAEAAARLVSFNNRFRAPLEETEIKHIVDEFDARITTEKENYYRFKAQTIVEFLDLTQGELAATNFFESKKQTDRRLAKVKTQAKRSARNLRICELRKTTNMTQQQIASEVGCGRTTVALVLKAAGLTNKMKKMTSKSATKTREFLRTTYNVAQQNSASRNDHTPALFKILPYVSGSALVSPLPYSPFFVDESFGSLSAAVSGNLQLYEGSISYPFIVNLELSDSA